LVGEMKATVLNVDKLIYAANLGSLRTIEDDPRYAFRRAAEPRFRRGRSRCCRVEALHHKLSEPMALS
jgi:hypothetical protein